MEGSSWSGESTSASSSMCPRFWIRHTVECNPRCRFTCFQNVIIMLYRFIIDFHLLHISSSILLYHSIYLGPYLTTWRLPHLEERRFNLRAIYKVVLTDRRMATTVDSHDPPWWIDWQTIKGGYHESSQIQVMWLKQCHKPPIWEWFITNGDGLLLFYPHYPISQTTIWDG